MKRSYAGQRRSCRRGESGRDSRGRLRQARGQDRLLARSAAKDAAASLDFLREQSLLSFCSFLFFCSHVVVGEQADVDDIHEYLLLKGVAATSVHGGRAQEEREQAIRQFKAGEKVKSLCYRCLSRVTDATASFRMC